MEARELCVWIMSGGFGYLGYQSLNNQMFRILVSFIFLPFLIETQTEPKGMLGI